MTIIGKLMRGGSIEGSLIKDGSLKGSIPGVGKLKGMISLEKGQEKSRVGRAIVGQSKI